MRRISNFIKHKHPSGLANIVDVNTGNHIANKYLTKNWWNDQIGMRVFCDPVNGNDNCDGSSWSKATKTLQKAIDIIPSFLVTYSAVLIPAGTTVEGANISKVTVASSDLSNSWIPLDIIAVCDGATDDYFTNNGERNSFDNTPLIIDTSLHMLHFTVGYSNHGIFAIGADNKDAWGMVKLTTLTDEGNYNGIFGTSRFSGAVQFRGCIFDDGAKNRGHNYASWGYMGIFSFTDCHFTTPSLNTATGKWGGVFRFGEGSQQLIFSSGGNYDPTYPKPFSEALKVTNYTQFLSLGYDKYLGFNTVFVESININSATGKLDIYIQEDNKAVVTIKDDSSNYNITGTNKGVDITFDDVKITPLLPTADPTKAGVLWNDAGTVKVSVG